MKSANKNTITFVGGEDSVSASTRMTVGNLSEETIFRMTKTIKRLKRTNKYLHGVIAMDEQVMDSLRDVIAEWKQKAAQMERKVAESQQEAELWRNAATALTQGMERMTALNKQLSDYCDYWRSHAVKTA